MEHSHQQHLLLFIRELIGGVTVIVLTFNKLPTLFQMSQPHLLLCLSSFNIRFTPTLIGRVLVFILGSYTLHNF